jgi:hypothetical protein
MRFHIIAILAAGALAVGTSSALAAPTPAIVRGYIASFTANTITVKTATGMVTVAYDAKTKFGGEDRGTIDDVQPGKFLGIANIPGAASSKATEVTVFDESMRGRGEGDRPYVAPNGSHTRMTNGSVAPAKAGRMTNGTVGAMKAGDNKTITINYKGGNRTIVVTKDTPIVRLSPGTTKLLQANASITVRGQTTPKGVVANSVTIGKNGTKVPT